MIPLSGDILVQKFGVKKYPSKTYCLKDGYICGIVDGLEAVRQAVYCILNTERFQHVIYSWNFGVELQNLYGRSHGLVKTKIKKRIREALTQVDRITGVGGFSFLERGKRLLVSFEVYSSEGNFQAETEVEINV